MCVGVAILFTSVGLAEASPENVLEKESYSVALPQQNRVTVTGVVEDAMGTVVGVNVMEKGTTNGTVTNIDGEFSLSVAADAVLVVTYIGYVEQQIPLDGKTSFRILMKEDTQALEEVVVVGYGTQKKVNLTGSVASVNFEEQSLSRPITTVSSALAGLSAGVSVMQESGQPGSDGATIRIRGVGTLNDASPLVLIDGIPGTMDAVNPMDIESISILKDAASAAIYGSLAANGVVLITTKGGKSGRVNVNYSGRISFSQPTHLIEQVTNYADYMEWMNESFTNIGSTPHYAQSTIDTWREKAKNPNELNEHGVPNYVSYPNTNWQKELFSNGLIHTHNISVNGGAEKMRFLISAGYMDNEGLVENTSSKKYSLRANVDANPTSWLKLGARTFASMEDRDPGDFTNANYYLYQTCPGIYPRWNGALGYPEAPEEYSMSNNIFAWLNGKDGNRKTSRFNTTLYSSVNILKGLSWDFNLNYQRRWDEDKTWTNAMDKVRLSDGKVMTPGTVPSQMTTSFYNFGSWEYTIENILRYNTTIAEDHDINALAGYNEYYYYEYNNSAEKKGLMDQNVNVPDAATEMISIKGTATDRASRSFFGRINYAYKSKYLLEANFRYDGHSRFHKDRRWGGFPGFSAGWRITEESFMEHTRNFLDNLKIRASWGKLGAAGGKTVGDYEYQSTYALTNYSIGGAQNQGLAPTLFGNDFLTWESLTSADIGIDATFLRNRLTVELNYYQKKTDGILFTPNIYLTMGMKTAPRLNIAEMTNKGMEISIGWKDRIGDFSYSVSGNMNYNHNEVTKYKGEYKAEWQTNTNGDRVWVSNIGEVSTGTNQRILEGKMREEFYVMDVHRGKGAYFNADGTPNVKGGPKDGMIRTEQDMDWLNAMIAAGYKFMPNQTVDKKKIWYGDHIFADTNGDGIYGSADDYEFQNYSRNPKYTFGFQMSGAWKGFDLSMNWAGAAGRKIYWGSVAGYNSPATRVGFAMSTDISNNHYFYDPENPNDPRTNLTAKYGRLVNGESGFQSLTANSTLFLYNADYLKLKNLTVGYTLPQNIAKSIFTESIRVYFSGENLFTFTKFPGQDPELDAAATYTSVKQFAFGANITF